MRFGASSFMHWRVEARNLKREIWQKWAGWVFRSDTRCLVLFSREQEFQSADYAAAGHEDAGDFLVAGVAQVRQLQIGAEPSCVAGERQIPDWIGLVLDALGDADSGSRLQLTP